MPSKWKPRDPAIFPIRYSEATLQAYTTGRKVLLATVRTPAQARSALDKFREWRFCLRCKGTPAHRCFILERDLSIRASTNETPDGLIELYVYLRPKKLSSFTALNPELMETL